MKTLPIEAVREIREWRAKRAVLGRRVPPSRKELARKYGVQPATITEVAGGRNHRGVR